MALVLALGILLIAVPGFVSASGSIHLGYVEWDSEVASTHVIQAVLEDAGFVVEITPVGAAIMWQGLSTGDFDASVAAWLPVTHQHYLDEVQENVVDLGPNLHGAGLFLVTPAYVEIDSIAELNEHAGKFNNEIIGIDPGAGLMSLTEDAIEAYGLTLRLVDGSDAAMTAALRRAVQRGDWVVVTGWVPHWKYASWDLKNLEDPLGVYGGEETINTVVHKNFITENPRAVEILDRFYWSPGEMGEVMAAIQEGVDPKVAARDWVDANPDRVAEWLGQ